MVDMIKMLERKIFSGSQLNFEEAKMLGKIKKDEIYELLCSAGRISRFYNGNRVELCAIVNAKSGHCSEDCAFCAQSARHRARISVYPILPAEEILRQAVKVEAAGVKRFSLVTAGRGITGRDLDEILQAVYLLKRETSLHVCASLGIIGEAEAIKLKQAGVTTYHHNLESSRSYFPHTCTTHTYEDRVRTIESASRAGLRVCSGGIIGLGETMEQRVELAMELQKLGVDSVPLNFLNPIPGTPLENASAHPPLELLHVIALFRLVLPRSVIRLCGGRREGLRDTQALALTAGVNGLMVGDYLTTRGSALEEDMQLLQDLGLEAC